MLDVTAPGLAARNQRLKLAGEVKAYLAELLGADSPCVLEPAEVPSGIVVYTPGQVSAAAARALGLALVSAHVAPRLSCASIDARRAASTAEPALLPRRAARRVRRRPSLCAARSGNVGARCP